MDLVDLDHFEQNCSFQSRDYDEIDLLFHWTNLGRDQAFVLAEVPVRLFSDDVIVDGGVNDEGVATIISRLRCSCLS